MAKLTIETKTNIKEIEVTRNGKAVGSIYFSPADVSILKRLRDAQSKIQEIDVSASGGDVDALLREADRIDGELRKIIDEAFEYPCSDVVFGGSYCFTSCNGVSALEQFLTAAIGIIEDEITAEAEASKSRQEKYLAKYEK